MDVVTQIVDVTGRTTRTQRVVYDVACGDGVKRACWDAQMANQIASYKGQMLTLRVKVEQKGQYTNHTIEAFAPQGAQLPPDMNVGVAGAVQVGGTPGVAAPLVGGSTIPITPSSGSGVGSRWTPETTTRITKLACIEYAATLVGGLYAGAGPEAVEQALADVDKIAKHFYSQARSHEAQGQSSGQIIPTATTPQEVAAAVPGVQVGVAQVQDAAAEAPDVELPQGDVIQWD